MANQQRKRSAEDRQNEYMKGGKGRKDEIGGSGIYPAFTPDAPADAQVRAPGAFVRHAGARPKSKEDGKLEDSNSSVTDPDVQLAENEGMQTASKSSPRESRRQG